MSSFQVGRSELLAGKGYLRLEALKGLKGRKEKKKRIEKRNREIGEGKWKGEMEKRENGISFGFSIGEFPL